jgi:hypothetical protein
MESLDHSSYVEAVRSHRSERQRVAVNALKAAGIQDDGAQTGHIPNYVY